VRLNLRNVKTFVVIIFVHHHCYRSDYMADKPSYILLGGAGFLGRSFAKYLVDHELASLIRVVDKNTPMTCFMNPEHMRLFKEQLVDFKQADLTKEGRYHADLL